jgi:hypothetical protein
MAWYHFAEAVVLGTVAIAAGYVFFSAVSDFATGLINAHSTSALATAAGVVTTSGGLLVAATSGVSRALDRAALSRRASPHRTRLRLFFSRWRRGP